MIASARWNLGNSPTWSSCKAILFYISKIFVPWGGSSSPEQGEGHATIVVPTRDETADWTSLSLLGNV
jgi:hypothetical protein